MGRRNEPGSAWKVNLMVDAGTARCFYRVESRSLAEVRPVQPNVLNGAGTRDDPSGPCDADDRAAHSIDLDDRGFEQTWRLTGQPAL
jgi:hypothetical protein